MKLFASTLLISLIILVGSICDISAAQEDDAGRVKKPTGATSSSPKKGGGKVRSATSPNPRRPKSGSAELTIRTNPTGSAVFIENQLKGTTDANGSLIIPGLKAGTYTVTIRKPNFQEENRVVEVVAGKKHTAEFVLSPMPGSIRVTSPVAGAKLEVNGIAYSTDIEIPLTPGPYRIEISKLGYRTTTRDISVTSGQSVNLTIRLEPLPVEELLIQAQGKFDAQSYGEAIALARAIISAQPNHAKAYKLMGLSHYFVGNYAESVSAVAKAVVLGESVSIPVFHRHGGAWAGKTLCSGNLTFHQTTLEFISADYVDDNFRISYSQIYEMGLRDDIRLFTKIGKLKPNGKEERKDYSFYSPDAIAQGKMIYCSQCLPRMQLILQVLRQIKAQP